MGLLKNILLGLLGFVAITSYKYLPFVYFIRFYSLPVNHFILKKKYHKNRPNTITPQNSVEDLFGTVTRYTYCSPLECDFFGFHKNNATYQNELDFCRVETVLTKCSTFLINFKESNGSYPYIPLGSIEIHYLKDIKPFQKYRLETKIFTWDEKWLFLLTILKVGDRAHTISIGKAVFKNGRVTIKPEELIKASGYDLSRVEEVRARNYQHVTGLVDAKQLLDLKFE